MKPVRLAPNLVDHFYAGGAKIAALRGIETTSPRQPEEWVAATVPRVGEAPRGLASTVDGDLLRDLVAADPDAWVGPDAAGARVSEADTGILVKLLDAGQRLPVHVHPDRGFAASHLDCPYGKTEAWFVLDATDDGAVYLGWEDDVDPDELVARREAQDGAWMIERMHRIEVRPGDGILVPAGTVHAIGQGVFVTEVQEPTDFSILLEWSVTTSGREDSHLGLGFDAVMPTVTHTALAADDLAALSVHTDLTARYAHLASTLPAVADPFFRLDVAAPVADAPAAVAAGFAAVVVLDGEGTLEASGWSDVVARGDVLAVPAALGDWTLAGDVRALVARPGVDWPASLGRGSDA
ncbi:class I mannose-6-phosphate isomerase [Solicola sp. PLA-1-18]|uniref:class I mannose-6-phosphate isomerase n=1 Tax=Solicola sp. PLA-1-18 TaxID=3380532 RepID=UPI003B76DB7F